LNFDYSEKVQRLRAQLEAFMDELVYPNEKTYREQLAAAHNRWTVPPIMEELKKEARGAGLWNLFLPDSEYGAGLTNLEYAPLCEIMGRSPIAPEVFNCNAPDTGNMEVLVRYGTPEQKERWLEPLLRGEIRSCFAMTEPDVASSDATNIRARIERSGDEYVINGRKWWSSNIFDTRCQVAIFMGKTDPHAEPYRQQSMVLVPLDTPGVEICRDLSVFGYHDHSGHGDVVYDNVRVRTDNLLGEEGGGFAIAQARLGPGRIHHCMRSIGVAERALELMCKRAQYREPFGKPLSEQGIIQEWIAESRIEIEQARLLVLKSAWLMDTVGNKGARIEVSAIKVAVPNMALKILDRAIQVHGGAGVSQDFPLAEMYAHMRTLRLVDGPDEVHKRSVARQELRKHEHPQRTPVAAG
jgi:acyl-CoA dehydrogenase